MLASNDNNVTIDGTGVNVTISGGSATRMFDLPSGLSLTIKGLTFAKGVAQANDGGAITSAGTLTLNSDTFTNNQAGTGHNGGAVENDGSLTITGSTFDSNSAANGGGINSNGPLSISTSTFTSNIASVNGGAIESASGPRSSFSVTNSNFFSNTAAVTGGGIDAQTDVTLTGDTFGSTARPNSAILGGGAVNAGGGTAGQTRLQVNNSSFFGNKATGQAGAGGAIKTSDVTDVETSFFDLNTAPGLGGAIQYFITNSSSTPFDSVLELNQDTFVTNSAAFGGAVFSDVTVNSGTITVSMAECTLYGNQAQGTAALGGGLYASHTTSGKGAVPTTLVNDTFFQNTSGGGGGGMYLNFNDGNTPSNTDATATLTVYGLTSLTVYNNTAASGGGGVLVANAPKGGVAVDNNIFDGNSVTAPGYSGPVDFTLGDNQWLNDRGYNLVGSSDTMFTNGVNGDIVDQNNSPGLANSLAANNRLNGYPQTLALSTAPGTLGYETGEQGLAGQANPFGIDARGRTRQTNKVSIGAEDPDAI